MIGPDKETFLEIYKRVGGTYTDFARECAVQGIPIMSDRSFRRRRDAWVSGYAKPDPVAKDEQEDKPLAGGSKTPPEKVRTELKGKRFLFTVAQNNTWVHKEFLHNLEAFAEYIGAQIVVGKCRYNKSGFQNATSETDDGLWYDPAISKYFITESCVLVDAARKPVWCGELDILPTAALPLSGLDSYTGRADSIVPHVKVQLKAVATARYSPTKHMYTTGAVTQMNYIQRKAGQKAQFHHVFGALLVEVADSGQHYCRQIIADNSGSFYDLDKRVHRGEITTGHRAAGIQYGDLHAEHLSHTDQFFEFAEDLGRLVQPFNVFLHDAMDFSARNHHNIKDGYFLAERLASGADSVEGGVEHTVSVIERLANIVDYDTTVYIVESNHDLALRRWLLETTPHADVTNAAYWCKLNAIAYERIADGTSADDLNMFEIAADLAGVYTKARAPIVFLREDDSVLLGGEVECGNHGHRGPNGSRGSAQSFRNVGVKVNVGHGHSACIIDGVYMAGIACKLYLVYNKGPSSWSNSHIITYPNNKRAIITNYGREYHA